MTMKLRRLSRIGQRNSEVASDARLLLVDCIQCMPRDGLRHFESAT